MAQNMVCPMDACPNICYGRHTHTEAAQRTNESRSRCQYKAGNDRPSAGTRDGISVPPASTQSSGNPGPCLYVAEESHLRPRVLLAQAPGSKVPNGTVAEISFGFLEAETRGKQETRCAKPETSSQTRMGRDGDLGMSASRCESVGRPRQKLSRMMRSVELFVGAGGLGIGVSKAGFDPVAVIDWDRWACDTIRENRARGLEPFNLWPLHECDIRQFDFRHIADQVDLVTGGPPCQPFSLGGLHRAFLDERDMFPEAIRAVRTLRPRAFVLENVKGLTRETFANYLEYIRLQLRHPELVARGEEGWREHLSRLEDYETRGRYRGLEYRVVVRVLNAANYGVPQRRERVFIVGFRADTGIEWHFPKESHSQDALLWSQWRSGDYWEAHRVAKAHRPDGGRAKARALRLAGPPVTEPWVTIRDAIYDLPDPERAPLEAWNYHDHRFQPGARSYPGHTGSPLDEPAKTLKAGVHGVPGGENMLRRPDGSVRYFTVRESARLQTFPDDMVFHGSWTETMRQLGNAVPVELARKVVNGVKDRLTQTS